MKNRSKIIFLLAAGLSVLLLFKSALLAQEEEQRKIFQLKGKSYIVEASLPAGGESDVFFYGEITKNLSRDFPGENSFPRVAVSGDSFYVTWINYKKGRVSLCFYDSARDCSRALAGPGFKFIGCDTGMVFDNHLPRALIFKANDSDNDDLFAYSFASGEIKAITRTPASEKIFRVDIRGSSVGPHPMDEGEILPSHSNSSRGRPARSTVDQGIIIETETLYHRYRYLFEPGTLEAKLIYKKDISRRPGFPAQLSAEAVNTYIAFGDSITWGKMRMNNLPYDPTYQYHHPELAYPQKIKEKLESTYGDGILHYYNLGIPGDTTFAAAKRVHHELGLYSAKYFLCMLGTNDAYTQKFSLDSTLESLGFIVDAALNKNLQVVISTIPPRNDHFNIPDRVKQIEALNAGIIILAGEKNIKAIDTYKAFRNYNPPDGWKSLLEDRGASFTRTGEAGQHPSPLGHQVIADLFVPRILEFPPEIPAGLSSWKVDKSRVSLQWEAGYDFDLSHYEVVFGYVPGNLSLALRADTTTASLIRPPFFTGLSQPRVYFAVRAVDDSGSKSGLSAISTAVFE